MYMCIDQGGKYMGGGGGGGSRRFAPEMQKRALKNQK